ncbi:MAG: restriction endonuclease subunit S [Sulfuritalea sp.]|nr:restriction endonuclease subunit S [Sulfuritalea sp.]MDP1983320.1 restriction endonuclease subunit S [Sulfuritalea sp.]
MKIGEVAERVAMGPFGSSIKVSTFVEKGIPVISGQHLRGSRLEDNEFNFVSEEHADSLKNANVFQGDVVFTHAGNIGQCAYIPESSKYRRYVLSQRQFYMRCDKSKVLPEFITCFFKSAEGRHALLANASQTGVPSIARPVTYVRTIEIPLPPLAEQKAIAAVLGALDDKIELNRRMNATLEAMARALFQSWFVDFDPVRAKLDGRKPAGLDEATAALFPEHFQDSEVGHIPHGWTVGVLDELTSFVIGGDWGATEPTSDETVSCFCIRGADIPSLQSGGVGKMPTRFLKPSSVEKRQLADGDLAIEISGGSPTQCTGRPVLVSEALLQNLGQPLVASNFCRVVKLKSPAFSKFVYLWLRWLYDAGELFQFETGTTGIKNFAFVIFSEKYPVVVPDLRVAEAFDRAVAPLFARIQANSHQSRTLATLRDTLLPKLLSGELSVAKLQH